VVVDTLDRERNGSPHLGLTEADPAAVAATSGLPPASAFDDAGSLPDASSTRMQSDSSLITVDQAAQRLGPVVLAALSDQFNGSLTAVRSPDQNDRLFNERG